MLKPETIDISNDCIHACHVSFDLFCQRLERTTGIKFDPARDEFGWVQEPRRPDGIRQYWGISSELTFQNALGMLRLYTTQSGPPHPLVLHIWSPAPKEPIFRRSRRAHALRGHLAGGNPESQTNRLQPSGSTTWPVSHPDSNRSITEAYPKKPSSSSTLAVIDPASEKIGGADADADMTIHPPPAASQSEHSGSAQGSISDRESRPPSFMPTDEDDPLSANLDQSHPGDSETDSINQGNSDVEDQAPEEPGSLEVGLAATGNFPRTEGEVPLNLGLLLTTLNTADIRGGDQQPGETDEDYELRVAEENEMLAELENQRSVMHGPVVHRHSNNPITGSRQGSRARCVSSWTKKTGGSHADFSIMPRNRSHQHSASTSPDSRESSYPVKRTA